MASVLCTLASQRGSKKGLQQPSKPVCVTIENLEDFLLFLFKDRNLASTILAFKAAILSVLSPRQIVTSAQLRMLDKRCSSFETSG